MVDFDFHGFDNAFVHDVALLGEHRDGWLGHFFCCHDLPRRQLSKAFLPESKTDFGSLVL